MAGLQKIWTKIDSMKIFLAGWLRKFWERLKAGLRNNSLSVALSLFSGLIPAFLLLLMLRSELNQTKDQLQLLREQISYIREPVLVLRGVPDEPSKDGTFKGRLQIMNVGNDTAQNIYIHGWLLLVTDSLVYTYGQSPIPVGVSISMTRPPREKLKGLTLGPNEQKDISGELDQVITRAFISNSLETALKLAIKEMIRIREIFNGDYILFIECEYRRKSDLMPRADTAFFDFYPVAGPSTDALEKQIGGPALIRRLKDYMSNGNQLSISISSKYYLVAQHFAGMNKGGFIKAIPRTGS